MCYRVAKLEQNKNFLGLFYSLYYYQKCTQNIFSCQTQTVKKVVPFGTTRLEKVNLVFKWKHLVEWSSTSSNRECRENCKPREFCPVATVASSSNRVNIHHRGEFSQTFHPCGESSPNPHHYGELSLNLPKTVPLQTSIVVPLESTRFLTLY